MIQKIILLFLFVFTIVGSAGTVFSQGKDPGNLYSTWLRLSLSGKNQVEIEYYLRHVKEVDLHKVKERLRFFVLDNLKRQGVRAILLNGVDQDDLTMAMKKVRTEIRFAGMEYDELLKMKIKQELGILLTDL